MAKRSAKPDPVAIIEAAYTVELPERSWLDGLLDAIGPSIDRGLGVAGYVYDVSRRPIVVRTHALERCPVDFAMLSDALATSTDDYTQQSWLSGSVVTASEAPTFATHAALARHFHPAGIHDVFVINALDPSGIGCWLGAPLPELTTLDPKQRRQWERIAAHVASALRLRLRLDGAATAPDAVLRPSGALVDAQGGAAAARGQLRDAVRTLERARAGMRRRDPDGAVESWKAMVRAKWTLVEQFDSDGARYIVARVNEACAAGPELLAPRERQVLGFAALGHSNKLIAYELGLAPSTVRVLLARAGARLGVSSRTALVERYRRFLLQQ